MLQHNSNIAVSRDTAHLLSRHINGRGDDLHHESENQRRPHAHKSDQFQTCKQVFVNSSAAYDLKVSLIDPKLYLDVTAS